MAQKGTLKLLNSAQAAEIAGVTPSTIARWVRYNRVKAVKVGRWNRFTPQDLTLLLQELYTTTEFKARVKKMNQILTNRIKDETVARTKA